MLGKIADFRQPPDLSVSVCLPIAVMHGQNVDFCKQQIGLMQCVQLIMFSRHHVLKRRNAFSLSPSAPK